MIKDLLKDNGIETFIENELMGNIAPWNVSSGGVAPVKIKILNADYALSKELIVAFTNRLAHYLLFPLIFRNQIVRVS